MGSILNMAPYFPFPLGIPRRQQMIWGILSVDVNQKRVVVTFREGKEHIDLPHLIMVCRKEMLKDVARTCIGGSSDPLNQPKRIETVKE